MQLMKMGSDRRLQFPRVASVIWVMCLMALSLAACGRAPAARPPFSPAVQPDSNTNIQHKSEPHNAVMSLQPPSGYGGLYVQVSGEGWPQNMLVMVTIEDEKGRSETLAASDTDQAGNLTTGFLFPIDERWLASDSLWVVTTTADGRIETKANFTIVEPGAEIVASSPSTSTSVVASADTNQAMTDTVALLNEKKEHTVILPLIASTGPESRSSANRVNNRASRNSSNATRATASDAIQVEVAIDPGGSSAVDCGNAQGWITVVIYGDGGFDATKVDPGSVTVTSSADLGYHNDSATVLAAFTASSKHRPTTRGRQAYQWRWQWKDADGDGSTDMVMEFRLDYIDLECNAGSVMVAGRTKDGKRFEGTYGVDMLVLERS